MSYTQLLYHIVIRTKYSKEAIPDAHSDGLYRYIWGYIQNKRCRLLRINGMADHIHLLVEIHPSMAVSDFVKELKTSSHRWIKDSNLYNCFEGWGKEYAAFTVGNREKSIVYAYIKNQKEHHQKESCIDELKRLLQEECVDFDEKYLKSE